MTVSKAGKSDSSGAEAGAVGRRPLLWLNVLCLDAPLVALGWQLWWACVFHLILRPGECAALFLTAWGIYLVDRWVDSISHAQGTRRSVRADFCWRHRHSWPLLLLVVGLADGAVIFTSLDRLVLRHGVVLGAAALVYLVVNHAFSKLWRILPLKEMAVGYLFAAGTLVVFASRAGNVLTGLILTGLFFGALCSLNCLSIALWERDLDIEQGKDSFATTHPRAGVPVRISCLILAGGCFVAAIGFRSVWAVPASLALSALFLFLLHSISVARDERTALADLVLLVPLVLLAVERFS